MSDHPRSSCPLNEPASDHSDRHSRPSLAQTPRSPRPSVVHTRHFTQQDPGPLPFPPTRDANSNYLSNILNAQIILACTIIGVQVNLLTSSTLPMTPPICVLIILGLVLELTGAVLVVSQIQPQPQPIEAAHIVRPTALDDSIRQTLPIAFILMGIAIFMVAVVLTMFSIKTS